MMTDIAGMTHRLLLRLRETGAPAAALCMLSLGRAQGWLEGGLAAVLPVHSVC